MSYPLPDFLHTIEDHEVDRIEIVGDFYFRSRLLSEIGLVVPQHIHDYTHATFVGSGSARGWADGKWIGDKVRGEAFEIKAGQRHIFQALEANTFLSCVYHIPCVGDVKRL